MKAIGLLLAVVLAFTGRPLPIAGLAGCEHGCADACACAAAVEVTCCAVGADRDDAPSGQSVFDPGCACGQGHVYLLSGGPARLAPEAPDSPASVRAPREHDARLAALPSSVRLGPNPPPPRRGA